MELDYGRIFIPDVWKAVVERYTKGLPRYMRKKHGLEPHEYALAARGYSGTLVALPVAAAIGTEAWIIRKDCDCDSGHGSSVEGARTKESWVFIDDLIDTGKTLNECIMVIGTTPIEQVYYCRNWTGNGVCIWDI